MFRCKIPKGGLSVRNVRECQKLRGFLIVPTVNSRWSSCRNHAKLDEDANIVMGLTTRSAILR